MERLNMNSKRHCKEITFSNPSAQDTLENTQNCKTNYRTIRNATDCNISARSINPIFSSVLSVVPESKTTNSQLNVHKFQQQKSIRKRAIVSDYIARNQSFAYDRSKGIEIFDDDSIQFFQNLKKKVHENRLTRSKENYEPNRKMSKKTRNLFDTESLKLMKDFKENFTDKRQQSVVLSTTPVRGNKYKVNDVYRNRSIVPACEVESDVPTLNSMFNDDNFDSNLRTVFDDSSFSNSSKSSEYREHNLTRSRETSVNDEDYQDSINIISSNFTPPSPDDNCSNQSVDLNQSLSSTGRNVIDTVECEYFVLETEMKKFDNVNNIFDPCNKEFSALFNP